MNAVDVEVEATNLCDDIYELPYLHREVIFECQSLLIFSSVDFYAAIGDLFFPSHQERFIVLSSPF